MVPLPHAVMACLLSAVSTDTYTSGWDQRAFILPGVERREVHPRPRELRSLGHHTRSAPRVRHGRPGRVWVAVTLAAHQLSTLASSGRDASASVGGVGN